MQVNGAGAGGYYSGSSGASNVANTDKQFQAMLAGGGDDPAAMLQKITSDGMKGYWSWEIDQMKQKAAEKVMAGMHLTAAQIAALPDGQRAQIEQLIMREVEQQVKQMIEEEMKKHHKDAMGAGLSGGADPTGGVGGAVDITV